MHIRRVGVHDDLSDICAQMQPGNWASDNEMTSYQPKALQDFLQQNGILLLAYEADNIAGVALCYTMPHPDGNRMLYVHELDTHPNFRRQGIATQLMQAVFGLAKERGLSEVWLGADKDNAGANALYTKLNPVDADPTITYSYKVQ